MMRESKCSAGGCGRESIDHLDHGDYRVEGVDSVDSLNRIFYRKKLLVTCQVCISSRVKEVVPNSQGLPIKSPI
jgi:hypothetical protein